MNDLNHTMDMGNTFDSNFINQNRENKHEAIRNEQNRLNNEIRRQNHKSYDAGVDLNQSLYSENNSKQYEQIKDPNYRQQLQLEEQRRQMIEREKILLDREHAQRMNQLNQSMHMSNAYGGLNQYQASDDDQVYERDYDMNRRGTVQGGPSGLNIRTDHVDYQHQRQPAPSMKTPVSSRNQIGVKSNTYNSIPSQSAKKPTTEPVNSNKKPATKVPMSSSSFGKPIPNAGQKKPAVGKK